MFTHAVNRYVIEWLLSTWPDARPWRQSNEKHQHTAWPDRVSSQLIRTITKVHWLLWKKKKKKKREWPLTRLCFPESSFQAGETLSLLAERHSGCNTSWGWESGKEEEVWQNFKSNCKCCYLQSLESLSLSHTGLAREFRKVCIRSGTLHGLFFFFFNFYEV